MRRVLPGRSVPAALAALALLGLAIWRNGHPTEAARPAAGPATYVYVVDRSGSASPIRRRLLGAALAEMEGLPERTRVVVYRMGSDAQEAYDGTLGEAGADGVAAALARHALAPDREPGTDFPRMARALAAFSRSFGGRRFLVRVLTDGGDDRAGDARAAKAYRKAAGELLADRRMAEIAFLGVRPEFRAGVREAFGGAGGRLRILEGDQPLAWEAGAGP